MSSVPIATKSPGHRHTASSDTNKFDEALHERGGISSDTVYGDEFFGRHPNGWAKMREKFREPAAEMLGTMILALVGTGTNCQAVLSANTGVAASPRGDWVSVSLGWACGVSLGAWVAGGVSGGHVNPVVTLCMAIFRGFPWWKVPGYVLGQLIGAWAGALIVFGNYFHAIDIVEGGKGERTLTTAGLFGTFALDYMPSANCFFDEFIGTFILLMVVFAVTDKRNSAPPDGLVPLIVFFAILGIAVAFGMQTGFAINPARDLGPRIMTAMVGYGGQVFSFRHQYWIWSPLLGSVCGGVTASFIYDALIYLGPESFFNAPNESVRRQLTRQKNTSRPSGSHLEVAGQEV